MGAPESNGRLCTKLSDMLIGDYIQCEYVAPTANVAGDFQNLEVKSTLNELPTTPTSTANGYFYFIKTDKGLLVADRLVQSAISAQSLNSKGYLTGIKTNLGLIRSLSRDEFLKYISNSDLNGNITKADAKVWHGTNVAVTSSVGEIAYVEINQDRIGSTMCTSLNMNGTTLNGSYHCYIHMVSSQLNLYGIPIYGNFIETTDHPSGSARNAYTCYRPILEYIDNPKSTSIWA